MALSRSRPVSLSTGWRSSPSESLRKNPRNETEGGQLFSNVSAADIETLKRSAMNKMGLGSVFKVFLSAVYPFVDTRERPIAKFIAGNVFS